MASPVVVTRIQNRRGTQAQFDALYPPGYTGVGGYGSIVGFNATNFPDVLLPGEMAFCTDTRNVFLGNVNAEYVQLSAGDSSNVGVPYFIAVGETFIVPLYRQALYAMDIDVEGFLVVDGFLIEVD